MTFPSTFGPCDSSHLPPIISVGSHPILSSKTRPPSSACSQYNSTRWHPPYDGRKLRGGVMKRLALPFLLLLGLKAGITIPVIFGIVALVAFKGMWSGFTALFVTAALALRNLIPPSKIIQLPPANPQHVHVADYIGDYRREDHLSRIDDQSYHPYGVSAGTYLPPNY